jgi:hypothetical protein
MRPRHTNPSISIEVRVHNIRAVEGTRIVCWAASGLGWRSGSADGVAFDGSAACMVDAWGALFQWDGRFGVGVEGGEVG